MTETLMLHQLRNVFQKAFLAYTHEGFRMRDLLISTELEYGDRRAIIMCQQQRVNEAAKQYERARVAYVGHVLAGMSGSGGAVFP